MALQIYPLLNNKLDNDLVPDKVSFTDIYLSRTLESSVNIHLLD